MSGVVSVVSVVFGVDRTIAIISSGAAAAMRSCSHFKWKQQPLRRTLLHSSVNST